MLYRIGADAVVVLHTAFVAFVVLGGLLALRWRRAIWVHLPAAVWGAWIELSGGTCPLTPLENWLRRRGDQVAYAADFFEHWLLPALYPPSLTREVQLGLGVAVLAVNAAIYTRITYCTLRGRYRRGSQK